MSVWRCLVCGYEEEGAAAPEVCPVCGVGAESFECLDQDPSSAPSQGAGEGTFSGHLLILGAGIAGVSAAEAARRQAPQAQITLINNEEHAPYQRINLTRYLAQALPLASLFLHPDDWYEQQNIRLLRATISRMDLAQRSLLTSDGQSLSWDRLIIASGARAFLPPVPGHGLQGVGVCRSLADAQNILAQAQTAGRVLVIGGGLLGLETAGALAGQGCRVSLLERGAWLMTRQLDAGAGACLAGHIEKIGVDLRCNVGLRELQGQDDRVCTACLDDGSELAVDLVIFAVGIRSCSALAEQAGLSCDRTGILVDDLLATSDPTVWAAGDVCVHRGRSYGLWTVAQYQGSIAGANAVGGSTRFLGLQPTVRLKVLACDVISIGRITEEDQDQVLLDTGATSYRKLLIRDQQLVGAIMVGDAHGSAAIARLIEDAAPLPVSPEKNLESLICAIAGPRPSTSPTPSQESSMPSVTGSQTEKNLLMAFAGESQARNRYTYFAGAARKEGYQKIAAIFEETANQEKEHAKRFFSFLEGGMLEITATFPAGVIGSTAENLAAAAGGEHEEWSELYPAFAKTAREEGFPAIATVFEKISVAEKLHEERYRSLLAEIEAGQAFEKDTPVTWYCRNCGYTHEGTSAPQACPACAHSQQYFESLA